MFERASSETTPPKHTQNTPKNTQRGIGRVLKAHRRHRQRDEKPCVRHQEGRVQVGADRGEEDADEEVLKT